ncbi:MAG: rod shape-determining protein MreC [Deltaproteobacteria bacterium]|jgi:rod shape-determining protein MreC|nr:rod shape-determining protein MreC [Deltaproteobacteria bacterium]
MRKREKRSKQLRFFLLFGCLLTAILILFISMAGRKEFTTPHKFGLEVIGPFQTAISHASNYVSGFWDKYLALINVRRENEQLRQELLKYKIANIEYREAVATNIRLQKLLELKESLPPPTLTAEIIGKDPSLWFRTLTINRGSSDGVQKGMPVVTVEGVVGQVLTSSPNYSKVLLATDPNSAIDVITQKTRVQGIVKGLGREAFALHYVLKSAVVEKDDYVLTSGLGGVFPKGLMVGTVSGIKKSRRGMFQDIEIEPAVDFSQLEYLIIIMKKYSLTED